MRPPPFEFVRPSTVREAIHAVTEPEEGMFYSGGTELLLAMKLRVVHTGRLIDIKGIPGLNDITLIDRDMIEIGARCTYKKITNDALIQQYIPALSRLCANVANIRVRATGTIGGNLCFGEPHADPPTMLAAVGGRLRLVGQNGERFVEADEFITDELETVREPDEILTHILVPMPTGPVTYRRFRHGERPSVNVAMAWSLDVSGAAIKSARVRVGALGSRPQPLKAVEGALRGTSVTGACSAIGAVLPSALDELEVNEDRHGSADYKRHLAGVLLLRNAEEATGHARGCLK